VGFCFLGKGSNVRVVKACRLEEIKPTIAGE
jgi:hypothetical protein